MDANLVGMGYPGEDASRGPADSRRQQPWQSYGQDAGPAPANGYENSGQGWQQDYGGDVGGGGYPAVSGYTQPGGFSAAGGYPAGGYETDRHWAGGEYAPSGQVAAAYGSPGTGAHSTGTGAYSGQPGYGQQDYVGPAYEQRGYNQSGYEQQGYEQQDYGQQDYGQQNHEQNYAAPTYELQAYGQGYEQPGYEQPGYAAPTYGEGYAQQGYSQGYEQQGYEQLGDQAYGQSPGGSGYAVNDWYGNGTGGGFADTSMDLPAISDRGGLLGYPPPSPAGPAALPPALPAAPASATGPIEGLRQTRQQPALGDGTHLAYPGYAGAPGHDDPGYDGNTAVIDTFDADFGGQGEYEQYEQYEQGHETYQDHGGDDPAEADGVTSAEEEEGASAAAEVEAGITASSPSAGTSPKSRKGRTRRRIVVSSLAVVCLIAAAATVYTLILKPKNSASTAASPNAPLPTAGASTAAAPIAACQKKLGTYCHIELRTDDPSPLTVGEVFPPIFLNEKDHQSFQRVAIRTDTKNYCASAVFGSQLVSELKKGDCTQFLRATYVAGTGKNQIVGTIGVANLKTTNDAHYAGRVVGTNDFIAPVTTSSGPAKHVGQGNGLSQSKFKGHYLILVWSQFANSGSGSSPTTAQRNDLSQFESDLVADTVNIALSQRMVGSKTTSAGA